MIQEINKQLLINLNSLLDYSIVEYITLCFADTPIFFLPIFLMWYWIYYSYKKDNTVISEINLTKNLLQKENLIYIFYSVLLWIIISITIQQMIHIQRPETVLEWTGKLLLKHLPDASFPSDHATVSVAFLTSLFLAWYKKIWLIFTPFVILMLLSRVILWVHWPLDIIVWSLVWIFSSCIIFNYITKIKIINKLNRFLIKIMWFLKM
jgi:membrane-associated phospholipid phosphatase